MALVGTVSGSASGGSLTSATAISGTLIIADSPATGFPNLASGVKLFVSGNKTDLGADTPGTIFGGDAFVSGALGTDSYFQMKPVGTLRIPTNTTASYVYTSGSTNDLYFTQYQPGTGYTNTTRLRWIESNLQTGLQFGGVISSTSGSTTYNISSGSGIIISQNASLTNDPYPTIVHVEWGNLNNQALPSISTTQITYVAMDSTGTPYLKSTPFIDGDYEDYIVLGRVLHTDKVGTNGAVNQPQVAYGTNQFRGDFVRAFGPIKISGHTFYVSGTTGLKKDAGDSYAEGRNYTVNPSSPNYILSTSDTAQNTSKIFYEYVDSAGDDVILNNGNLGYSAVDFAQYNNGGTLATVGAGNKFTIQRVYWFPNAVNRAFYVYYGNTIYSTIADAQAGIATEVFTEGKNTRDSAIFLGYLIVKGTLVDFTDSTTYKVIQAGAFRAVASAGGGGASGTPGGATTQVQFNDAGVFNGTSDFTFAKTAGTVSMANLIVSGTTAGSLVSSGTIHVKDTGGITVASISSQGVISGSGNLLAGGNITSAGDLAVNGGDLTTTSTTFNLVNATATTVNFAGGASTALTIGPSSGVTTIAGDLKVSGNDIIASDNQTNITMTSSTLTTVAGDLRIGGNDIQASDGTTAITLTATTGDATIAGDLAVNGGDITTTASTFNLVNATATTVNFAAGASTALNIGPAAGTTTISGDLSVNGGDITTSPTTNTTFNLLSVLGTGTVLNIGGSAATFNVGVSTGTSTINLGSGTNTVAGATKTINIGSNTSTAGSVFVNIGSQAARDGNARITLHNEVHLTSGTLVGSPGGVNNALTLISSGSAVIRLDTNNDAPGHRFEVRDFNNAVQFAVSETGDAEVTANLLITGSSLNTATTTTFNLLNTSLTGTLNISSLANSILIGGTLTTSSIQGSAQIDGRSTLSSITEKLVPSVGGTGTVAYDLSLASIFYANNPSGNITANFTNVPTTNNRIITPTIILSQSATGRIVNAVQIDTVAQTINWANNVIPTGNANKQDVFGFSLIRSGSTWKVLGQMSTYG